MQSDSATRDSIGERRMHARFPAEAFSSHAEFAAYCAKQRSVLDARYAHERALAVPPGLHIRSGTCAPCLRAAGFSFSRAEGEQLQGGLVVANWREELVCDCQDRLNNRARATLHFVQSVVGLASWHRVLAFGRMSEAEGRLCRRLGETMAVPRLVLDRSRARIAARSASCQLAVTFDYLHQVPDLLAALKELRRVLVPGGALVFTVPFRWDRPATRSHVDRAASHLPADSAREVHELGWDALAWLQEAGFSRSRAHVYWSDELGYLGPFNMIFSATA